MLLIQNLWVLQNRKTTLCIDTYDGARMQGRLFGADMAEECFESFIQFLVKMDMILEEMQAPQSYTSARTFSPFLVPLESNRVPGGYPKGECATFELQILFRQHTTWQGILVWKEGKQEQSFRSVLELAFLLDSALRSTEGKKVV